MERIVTPFGGAIERKQGCWNCTAWNNQERAREFWNFKRLATLEQGRLTALNQPEGEHHPQVVSIRRMVDNVDRAVAAGILGICTIGACETDLVHNAYLCDRWVGAPGASVAIAGEKPDALPEELRADAEAGRTKE